MFALGGGVLAQGDRNKLAMPTTGQCHCGQTKYEAQGPAVKSNYCDGRGCQRANGTLKSAILVVRRAVDYIRGQGLFAPRQPAVDGLAAMDAWIKHMQTVKGYCAPCFGRGQQSWHDAMENGERLLRGAGVAAKKLRSFGSQYEPAAKHYDRIVELLKPVKYQEFIGDLDKQKTHAEMVLVPVRAELAAVAEELAKVAGK